MRKSVYIAVLGLFIVGVFCFMRSPGPTKEKQVAIQVRRQADSLVGFIQKTFIPAAQHDASTKKLQALLLQARLLYKRFEWAAEYFTPATAKLFNGAPVPAIEMGQMAIPQGLQVIETLVYPSYQPANKTALLQQLQLLCTAKQELDAYFTNIDLLNWQVFDAIKLQVFRIETLGITGFDAPLAKTGMVEAASSINSMRRVISLYTGSTKVNEAFANVAQYLAGNPAFNSFNRAAFITGYANPLTKTITALVNTLQIPRVQYSRLLRQGAATLFDSNAFDVRAYTPGLVYNISAKQVALGEKLFNEPILSGTQQRSCASCHTPPNAFTDGLVKNNSLHSAALLKRNTPTLLNAALQPVQFYDMRALSLEQQVMDVLQNHDEMDANADTMVNRLAASRHYRQLFADAFAGEAYTAVDTITIAKAIAEYVRSLTKLNSSFDAFMQGDTSAITTQQITGFNLFMGKAKCGTCHYMPLFNGVLPPAYTAEEPEVIGVPATKGSTIIDADEGVYKTIHAAFYRHAFKTPTLRNAALTGPYMHNGAFTTLAEVLEFYNNGGGTGTGINLPNQTLPADSLHLTPTETEDIIAFIKSLDSR